jgi:hypothetical protein
MRRGVLLASLLVVAVAPAVAAKSLAGPAPVPVPADVKQGLACHSIGVVDASDAAPRSLAVDSRMALRIVRTHTVWTIPHPKYNHGWTLAGRRITVHLVRLTDPPSGSNGLVSTAPLHAGSLVWLVVIRNVEIPVLGPRGGSYLADVAVFVETTRPRFVVALTI